MLPTFHMNNFKPWAPPHGKPFLPHKPLNSRSPRTSNLPHPKPRHDSFPSTLPFPKHHLPARPPAKVCVHISTNTQPRTPLSSQFQPQEISVPPLNTPYSENPKQGTTSPHDPAPHTSNSDPISPCDFQEITDIPIEPPFFRGEDIAEDGLPSPSISSSDDSLEEFFRLPGLQSNIPIDPVILANDGPWGASDLHQTVPQGDSLIISETICPYPEPPPVLHNAPDHHRDSGEGAGSRDGNTRTSDHPPIHGHQQSHSSHHNTDPDVSPNGASENSHVGGQFKTSKRKTQRSDGRAPKRLRVPSKLPTREDSCTALCSHFLLLPLDERLRFLSWLFEGALPRCMPEAGPAACEDGNVRSASHSTSLCGISQTLGDSSEAQGTSRRGMPWSTEEVDLLLWLKRHERRPWSEVTRLFSDRYPGRSQGSIQVYWSTTLKNKVNPPPRDPG
jgi:hypothetical protein